MCVSALQARALWYMIETVAQVNNSVDGRIVQILWGKETTMFDYDSKVNDRINFFRDCAWPVRVAAIHTCCSPKFVVRILKPYVRHADSGFLFMSVVNLLTSLILRTLAS